MDHRERAGMTPESSSDWIGNAQAAYEAQEVYALCRDCGGVGATLNAYDDPISGPGQDRWDACDRCGGTGNVAGAVGGADCAWCNCTSSTEQEHLDHLCDEHGVCGHDE